MEMEEYLGDGLYASWDGYQIRLSANSQTNPSDTVFLNDFTYAALQRFAARCYSTNIEETSD